MVALSGWELRGVEGLLKRYCGGKVGEVRREENKLSEGQKIKS